MFQLNSKFEVCLVKVTSH